MMKRTLKIALLALGGSQLVATVPAVNVPQTSASDYVFTVPRLTNHIHGVLIDTTNAYGVIRSEDVDWLNEAFAERASILAGAIPTNHKDLGVGPQVKRTDRPFSNIGYPGGYTSDEWLDGDAPLLANCRLYWGSPSCTNIYDRTDYTNGFTNAYSVITMPMTNGTTSVFTNCWTNSYMFPVTTVVTNIHGMNGVDLCHGVDGVPFPIYSNALERLWWRVNETKIPNARYFGDALVALRGTVRLADDPGAFNWTNVVRTINDDYSDIHEPHYSIISTNFSTAVVYDFGSSEHGAGRELTDVFTADVYTRFHSSIATNRVAVEAAYAHCWFSYHQNPGNSVSTNAVIRLGNPTLDTSGENAFCRVLLDAHSLCSTCASAAGVPAPPSSLSYRSTEGHRESWYLSVDYITIFYRITPATRLPDW